MDAHESEDGRVRARVGSRATPTAYRVPRSQGGTDTHHHYIIQTPAGSAD